ncbi:MAG: M20/M25/M40 family metallo-hydrolase [Halobacteriaceae archaeon]
MDDDQRAFLDELLTAPAPSGYERRAQRRWVEYVRPHADDVRVDDYGNAVATVHGDGPDLAFAGHGDEIGFVVTKVTEEGFLRVAPVGGADRTVSRGQHVTVHGADGPVAGVIGQTAIHLRDPDEEGLDDITEQHVDVGAADEDDAREVVEVGDPVTVERGVRDLRGTRIAARATDNRVGMWVAAEAVRRAARDDVDATVHAVSTVQEEVGLQGARMVGFDVDPDAAVAVDVTHAADNPSYPPSRASEVDLGGGPVVSRGSSNHAVLVETLREAADGAGVAVQLQATGTRTGTDADSFYVQRGGIPSVNLGIPNRYMHTPAEVVDTTDLEDAAALLRAVAADPPATFALDV